MSFFIGRADKARPYSFTINTASSVLLMTCRTGPARANCPAGLPASDNYVLQAANAVKGSNCSSTATGVSCPLPDPLSNRCFVSEPVSVLQLAAAAGYVYLHACYLLLRAAVSAAGPGSDSWAGLDEQQLA